MFGLGDSLAMICSRNRSWVLILRTLFAFYITLTHNSRGRKFYGSVDFIVDSFIDLPEHCNALPFNSTGCGILPTFGGSPPFSGAKVPQPVLLNDLHIIKAVQNRVYSCLQLLPASTRFCFPSIPVGTAWRGITRVRKMQAFPNVLRVLPQRHRILGNAAVAVNGLHVHLRHRPY